MDIDALNDDLDKLSDQTYASPTDAWTAIASVLEDEGITAPLPDPIDSDMLFRIEHQGDEPLYLMVVMDFDPVEVYATVVDDAELTMADALLEPEPEAADTRDAIWLDGDAEDDGGGNHHLRTRKAD